MPTKKKSKLAESLVESEVLNDSIDSNENKDQQADVENIDVDKQAEIELGNVVENTKDDVILDIQKQLDEAQARYIECSDENKKITNNLKLKIEEIDKLQKEIAELRDALAKEQNKANELAELLEKNNAINRNAQENDDAEEYLQRIEDLKNRLREKEQEGMDNSFLVVKLQDENEKLQNMLLEKSKLLARATARTNASAIKTMGKSSDYWN